MAKVTARRGSTETETKPETKPEMEPEMEPETEMEPEMATLLSRSKPFSQTCTSAKEGGSQFLFATRDNYN